MNSDNESFTSEFEALEKVSRLNHSHLAEVTASITKGQEKLFVFPWAELNLRQYWQRDSRSIQRSQVQSGQWAQQQLTGLASALDALHNNDFGSCRHGDLKPENILWFKDQSNLASPGRLVISDFGFAKFSSQQDANQDDLLKAYTPAYSPPEVQKAPKRSRKYDIWSLGCIYLEFVTWLMHGFEAVETLRIPLNTTIGDKTYENDRFKQPFHEFRYDWGQEWIKGGLTPRVLKVSCHYSATYSINDPMLIIRWHQSIDQLRHDAGGSSFFLDLLDFVQYRMLEPSPEKRADAFEGLEYDASLDQIYHASEAEDSDWDEYHVQDALLHNLTADGTLLESQTYSLESQQDASLEHISDPVDQSWDSWTDEPSSADPVHSVLPMESQAICPFSTHSWNETIDSGYHSMPIDSSQHITSFNSQSCPSQHKRGLESPSLRPKTCIKRLKIGANALPQTINTENSHPSLSSEGSKESPVFPCPFQQHNPAKFGTNAWRSCVGLGWTISRLK